MSTPHLAADLPEADQGRRTASPSSPDVRVICASRGWRLLNLREIWKYRELLCFLVWRDIKVRYKQTALGATWAILQPAITLAIFAAIFGRFVGLADRTGGAPYPLFVLAGLVPWMFFAKVLSGASTSVVSSSNLIKKIYFPRLLIPVSLVGASLIDIALGLGLFALLMVIGYGIFPTVAVVWLPLFVLLTAMAALAVGIWISAMMVAYRDFAYVVPFLTQVWMYLSPVIYPSSIIPEPYRWLLYANPVAGLLNGFRYCLLGQALDWTAVSVSVATTVVGFVLSILYFRRVESMFADYM